jgi:hypothetical protein
MYARVHPAANGSKNKPSAYPSHRRIVERGKQLLHRIIAKTGVRIGKNKDMGRSHIVYALNHVPEHCGFPSPLSERMKVYIIIAPRIIFHDPCGPVGRAVDPHMYPDMTASTLFPAEGEEIIKALPYIPLLVIRGYEYRTAQRVLFKTLR